MNQKRIELLKIIRKENPSLQLYMTDLLNEMEDPASAFNTGEISKTANLDRLTTMRLCDAFAVAKKYSEKYHLDLPELIEFISEKTLEVILQNKVKSAEAFEAQMERLIRQQYPFRNPLILRSGRQNILSYEIYDRDAQLGCIDENGKYYENIPRENIGLNMPMLFTKNLNILYMNDFEQNLESKELKERMAKALEILTPQEKRVMKIRFGFEDGIFRDLVRAGKILGMSGERVRQIEAKSIRKLRSRKVSNMLDHFLNKDSCCHPPVRFAYTGKITVENNFNTLICLQPYCVCKHQMRYQQSTLVDGNLMMVFYCRNCGRIYRFRNGKAKIVRAYHLKGYALDNVPEKWPLFHWDKTNTDDFSKRIEKYENKMEMLHYVERIRQRYYNNRVLSSAKESEVRNIYDLMNKNIISAEEAKEKYFVALYRFLPFKEYLQDDPGQFD